MTAWSRRLTIAAAMAATLIIGLLSGLPRPAAESGPEAFAHIYRVATHPRCLNCHGTGKGEASTPLVGDDVQPHPMNITLRHNPGAAGKPLGIDCGTCHQDRDLKDRGTPPGAASPRLRWKMPDDDEMRVLRIRSAAGVSEEAKQGALCKVWEHFLKEMKGKDPDFMGHIAGDPLVKWALTETPTRQAAPGGHARLLQAVDTWIKWLESGGSCDTLAQSATPAVKPR